MKNADGSDVPSALMRVTDSGWSRAIARWARPCRATGHVRFEEPDILLAERCGTLRSSFPVGVGGILNGLRRNELICYEFTL